MRGKKTRILGVVLVLVIILVAVIGSSYNGMMRLDEDVNQAWSQVQTSYQRRADLIPNLVNTVKGAAEHESSTFEAVAKLRSGYQEAKTPAEYEALDQQFQKSLNIVVENYPQLQANQNFLSLQDELAGTENRIAVARRDYNGVATGYNKKIRAFPRNLIAGLLGFHKRDLFQAAPGSENAPTVDFGSKK